MRTPRLSRCLPFSSPEPVVSWSRGRKTRGSGRSRYRMSENFWHPVAHVQKALSRLVVFVETSQTLPAILFFTAIAYKQTRIVAVNETQTRISCSQARSKMLCAVDYIFNLLCAFNCLQPMKKFVFSVASRATGRLQIKPSGSGDENGCLPAVRLGYVTEINWPRGPEKSPYRD